MRAVRHGETVMNYNNTFTGWIDTDLSERGIKEMEHAANLILERGYNVDVTYTSRLKRAVRFVRHLRLLLRVTCCSIDKVFVDIEYGP